MKKLIILFFIISSVNITAQTMGEWTWMKGPNTPYSLGVFGIKGVPDTANYPPALYEACSWTDTAGNFWLFGGVYNNNTQWSTYLYNSLWRFTPQNNTWTWISGSNIPNDMGNFGIKGVPSSTNSPPARGYGAMAWKDNNNNLWLYGGFTYIGSVPVTDVSQDLWKYDISLNQWTWESGSNSFNYVTDYGIKGVPSSNNCPPPIEENNCTWVDKYNNLWFYGGFYHDILQRKYYNDLWKYNISNNQWTWIFGNATPNTPINFGQKGVIDSTNNPGGRCSYTSFYDKTDNFYFFGSGNNITEPSTGSGLLNDIWKYNVDSNIWTWISGDNLFNSLGSYGNLCVPYTEKAPMSRFEARQCWTDDCGLWIYGGFITSPLFGTLSDLWRYEYLNNKWIRINGSIYNNETVVYGNYQVSSPNNKPGGRGGSGAWMDKQGNLWMFGGQTYSNFLADLWRFVPDTNCVKLCLPNINPPIPNPNPDTLNPEIKIPNIFTPNADGINDKFEIIARNYKSYYLQVFNRWGVLVFETKDVAILWDGTMHNHGNACADGVYFYILNLHDFKQNTTQHKGSVTILR